MSAALGVRSDRVELSIADRNAQRSSGGAVRGGYSERRSAGELDPVFRAAVEAIEAAAFQAPPVVVVLDACDATPLEPVERRAACRALTRAVLELLDKHSVALPGREIQIH